MQYSVIIASEGCSTEIIKSKYIKIILLKSGYSTFDDDYSFTYLVKIGISGSNYYIFSEFIFLYN